MCIPKVKYRLLIIDLVQLKIKELRLPLILILFKTTKIKFEALFRFSTKITLHTVGQQLYITNWLPYHVL